MLYNYLRGMSGAPHRIEKKTTKNTTPEAFLERTGISNMFACSLLHYPRCLLAA